MTEGGRENRFISRFKSLDYHIKETIERSEPMNEKFEFELLLNCHAPIIHFQHAQAGVTLRATEVKPKLDRFLTRKYTKDPKQQNKSIPPEWLAKKASDNAETGIALDYKLRFTAEGKQTAVDDEKFKKFRIFYGNTGAENKKLPLMGNCRLHIVCFHPELLDFIKKNITEFFAVTNFGTMQGKGFGSFLPADISADDKKKIPRWLKEETGSANCYYIGKYSEFNGKTAIQLIFEDIKNLYTIMKSGSSFRARSESYLFRYMKPLGSEQTALKQAGLSPSGVPYGRPIPCKYMRVMLGLGDTISYRGSTQIVTIADKRAKEPDAIDRLASPIFFKIVDNGFYVTAKRIVDRAFDRSFVFTNSAKVNEPLTLESPTSDEFNIDKFLAWFMDEYSHLQKSHPHRIKKDIIKL